MTALRPAHWLASYPKSGNTWMRFLLTAYQWGDLAINAAFESTMGDGQPYAYHTVSPLPLKDMSPTEILFLRHAALVHIIARFPHNPVILKTHNANVRAGSVDLIPKEMTAPSIYIVRDPRDVLISYAEHMGHTLEQAAGTMNEMGACLDQGQLGIYHHLTTWSQHVRSWADDAKFDLLVVRYEDMLEDPKRELRRAVEHMGMPLYEERLDNAVELCRFERLRGQEDEQGFKEKSPKAERVFVRGTAGNWREGVPVDLVAKIEQDHGEVMERMGYELEFQPVTEE